MKKYIVVIVMAVVMVIFCTSCGKKDSYDHNKTMKHLEQNLEFALYSSTIKYERDNIYGSRKYEEVEKWRDFYIEKGFVVSEIYWAKGSSTPVFWIHVQKIAE